MSVIFRTALFLLACCFMVPLDAAAWDRGRVERFASLPEGAPHPEGITADHNGYVYDSFQGVIWKTGPTGGAVTAWKNDPLLRTTGFPPFGANGLQFNSDESALFVANTGDDTVIKIASSAGLAGKAEVFAESINGADGLMLDEDDNVWVCANQADEIVVIDKSGKVIAKIGDFNGVRNGSPVGLLFPASLVRSGDWIYITNLSLDTTSIGLPQSVDSQWAAQVRTHTISRIRFRIPGNDRDAD